MGQLFSSNTPNVPSLTYARLWYGVLLTKIIASNIFKPAATPLASMWFGCFKGIFNRKRVMDDFFTFKYMPKNYPIMSGSEEIKKIDSFACR